MVELRGDQHHGDQDDPSGDEVGETISRSERTWRVYWWVHPDGLDA